MSTEPNGPYTVYALLVCNMSSFYVVWNDALFLSYSADKIQAKRPTDP